MASIQEINAALGEGNYGGVARDGYAFQLLTDYWGKEFKNISIDTDIFENLYVNHMESWSQIGLTWGVNNLINKEYSPTIYDYKILIDKIFKLNLHTQSNFVDVMGKIISPIKNKKLIRQRPLGFYGMLVDMFIAHGNSFPFWEAIAPTKDDISLLNKEQKEAIKVILDSRYSNDLLNNLSGELVVDLVGVKGAKNVMENYRGNSYGWETDMLIAYEDALSDDDMFDVGDKNIWLFKSVGHWLGATKRDDIDPEQVIKFYKDATTTEKKQWNWIFQDYVTSLRGGMGSLFTTDEYRRLMAVSDAPASGLSVCSDSSLENYVAITTVDEQKGASADFMSMRFYTEEEILAYPNLFHYKIIRYPRFYMSRKVMQETNKVWGERSRFKKEGTQFSDIVKNNKLFDFTTENLLYVKGKTGVNNVDFISAISKLDLNIYKGISPNVQKLIKFIED